MAKTNEELQKIRSEVESLGKRLAELNEEELTQVVGGMADRPEGVMPIIFAGLMREQVFDGISDGNGRVVHIDLDDPNGPNK